MNIDRLFDVMYFQKKEFPQQVCLANKENGSWKTYSTDEVIHNVEQLALGLIELGIEEGDKVGIISFNRPEWIFADLAIQETGAVNVPLYPTITVKDYAFALNQSECKAVFVDNAELYDKVIEATPELIKDRMVFTFDEVAGAPCWKELLKPDPQPDQLEILEFRKSNVKKKDLVTIIYTSGTTGEPKGVMLSHANIINCSDGVLEFFKTVSPDYRSLSFLPLCHIFERSDSYTQIRLGTSIYFSEMEEIGANMLDIKPHYFATVPRLLEKVYDKIIKKGYELTGIKRMLFFWAIRLGEKYEPNTDMGQLYSLQLKIANKLIFSKWREALGGNIVFIVSGAAALQPRLGRVFWAAGIRIIEAYGLTETSPGITFSGIGPGEYLVGCVGTAMKNVEIKIAVDGEILTRGPSVMLGYYKKEELTTEVIDDEGWFHTGDVGELVNDKFLKITDRKKEMFKTSGGKYIAPQQMENQFKQSMFIEQIMVVGEGQKHPSALVVPEFQMLQDWCELHNIKCQGHTEMVGQQEVIDKFERELGKINDNYAQYEKVKKFKLLPNLWSIGTGELTPTLKLKRKAILSKYDRDVHDFYKE